MIYKFVHIFHIYWSGSSSSVYAALLVSSSSSLLAAHLRTLPFNISPIRMSRLNKVRMNAIIACPWYSVGFSSIQGDTPHSFSSKVMCPDPKLKSRCRRNGYPRTIVLPLKRLDNKILDMSETPAQRTSELKHHVIGGGYSNNKSIEIEFQVRKIGESITL